MDRILPYILGTLTQHNRQKIVAGVDFEWSTSWTYNLFRVYELIFWRREGIRAEMSATKNGVMTFHSWEAGLVYFETVIRAFRLPKIVKVYVPVLAPIGFPTLPVLPQFAYKFAIALDTSAKSTESNNTGQSWTHTCTGSNGALHVGDTLESTTSDQYTNMTYNSVAMTASTSKASSNRFGKMWYKNGPPTGSAFTIQPTNTSQFNQGGSISFSGVNQTGIDNTATASGTSTTPSVSITPNTAGNTCWVIAFLVGDAGSTFTASNLTNRQSGTAPFVIADSNGTVSSSGVTVGWTVNSSGNWAEIAVSVAPVASTVNSNFLAFF